MIQKIQEQKLVDVIQYVREHSPFYKKYFGYYAFYPHSRKNEELNNLIPSYTMIKTGTAG